MELFAQAAGDPWRRDVFHAVTLTLLWYALPLLASLVLGMGIAFRYRRRYPGVARRVFLGCLFLFTREMVAAFSHWAWLVFDPDPVREHVSAHPVAAMYFPWVVGTPLEVAAVWQFVSAVLLARTEPSTENPSE